MTAETFTTDPGDAAELSPLHRQVLDSATKLLEPGRPIGYDVIGRHVWERLSAQQRADSIPELLVAYVAKIQYEALQREYAQVAAGPATNTYLGDDDTTLLWEALTESDDSQEHVTVDRQALLNVTCELELLQTRLDLARGEAGA